MHAKMSDILFLTICKQNTHKHSTSYQIFVLHQLADAEKHMFFCKGQLFSAAGGYFYQQTGALHAVCWSKSSLSVFFPQKVE